ncbi:MAG TPA: hypothetical protein VFM41_02370 [Gaiella sp.]|nr:hypothetical protein [Gaiella sp.]
MTLRVFGRTEYAEPLVEVGTAEERSEVLGTHEGEWVELVSFPEDAIHWIVRDGDRVDDE